MGTRRLLLIFLPNQSQAVSILLQESLAVPDHLDLQSPGGLRPSQLLETDVDYGIGYGPIVGGHAEDL